MSLRHSVHTLTRRARPRLASSLPPPTTTTTPSRTFLALARKRATASPSHHPHTPTTTPSSPAPLHRCHQQQQTRSYSSSSARIPGLVPPWQFEDLSSSERKAFERHGPLYLDHMPASARERVQHARQTRADKAAKYEAKYGANWYKILKAATAIKDQAEKGPEKLMLSHAEGLPSMKDRKALKLQFYGEIKRTREQRLDEAMKIAAQRLGWEGSEEKS